MTVWINLLNFQLIFTQQVIKNQSNCFYGGCDMSGWVYDSEQLLTNYETQNFSEI